MIYHSLRVLFYDVKAVLQEKLSLRCCKSRLAQASKGNCVKFAHRYFLIFVEQDSPNGKWSNLSNVMQ